MQIFGRAGRPQFDSSGEGIIITKQKCLSHYLALMNNQMPIESRFNERLSALSALMLLLFPLH